MIPAALASHRRTLALLYGVGCHGLFVIAVLTAMWAMYHGMMSGRVHLPAGWALLWNLLLLLQFPVLHSFLLSKRGSAVLGRLAPRELSADLSTTLFTLVASFQLLLLYLAWAPMGPIWWQAHGVWKGLLSLLYLASWLALGKAMADAGLAIQTGFLGWNAVFQGQRPRYGGMPVSGLFRHVRHPVYLAFACIVWTVPVWTPDQLMLATWFTAYCLLGPLMKEARYARRYGQSFADYQRRVPYILPWHGPAQKL